MFSIDAEKAFGEVERPYVIKVFKEINIEENYINTKKAI